LIDNRREWTRAKDELVAAIVGLGFLEELGVQIAKQLGSPKAMQRMMAYLCYEKPREMSKTRRITLRSLRLPLMDCTVQGLLSLRCLRSMMPLLRITGRG